MTNPPVDDFWQGIHADTVASAPADGPGLAIEVIDIPAPLDGQFGTFQKKAVPEPLAAALFHPDEATRTGTETQPADASDAHVYAILDGAKIDGLRDRLEQSGLPHLCLFKGRSAADMGDLAPWIVRLDAESRFVRNLFTRGAAPWQLWDDAPGIFLRARSDLDTIQAHLRHFTRLRDEDGQWLYFRFWEPAVAAIYFAGMADRPDLARLWFHPRKGPPIDRLAIVTPMPARSQAMIVRPRNLAEVPHQPMADRLIRRDIQRLADARRAADTTELARALRDAFPDDLTMPDADLYRATSVALERLMATGFRQRDILFMMLAWELLFGPGFEAIDPDGQLARIMRSDGDESERFDRLRQRMDQLG